RVPGLEFLETRRRSGIGRLSGRPDIAALAVVFSFAALLNAFAMTAPAFALEQKIAGLMHVTSEAMVLGLLFGISLLIIPAAMLYAAAAATRAVAGTVAKPLRATAIRYAVALIPFGLGVWLAHYGFHLLTGILTVVPVTQSAAVDLLGWAALGEPAWRWAGMQPGFVQPIQLGFVFLGTCGSLGLVQAISLRDYPERSGATSAPWLLAIPFLCGAAVWMLRPARVGLLATTLAVASPVVFAHDGPPFPILSDRVAGPYLVSIWTDPD